MLSFTDVRVSCHMGSLGEIVLCVFKGKLPNYFDGVNVEMVTFTFKAVLLQMFQIHYVLC